MGARKKISAEKRKEALKTMYFAKLQNVPTSPRKMRLVADMIRGMEVNQCTRCLEVFFKRSCCKSGKVACALQLLTGSRKTNVKQKVASCS